MKHLSFFFKISLVVVVFILGSFFTTNAYAEASAGLGVTQITAVKTFASADNTFENGWKWVFDVTVPTDEIVLQMKFADWTNSAGAILAGGNIRFYSAQFSNASDGERAITVGATNTYSDSASLIVGADLDVAKAGRQIQIAVETRVPVGSAGGSYGTSYGIKSDKDKSVPIITLIGESSVTVVVGTTYTDAGATALDNVDGTITSKIVSVSSVNTSVVGAYRVTYNVSDNEGNLATEVARVVKVVADTSALVSDITTARALHGSAVEGTENGQYAVGSRATLLLVIETAESAVNNSNATQNEVDEKRTALENAVTVFESGKVNDTDTTAPTLLVYTVSGAYISPNSDGTENTVKIDVKFSEKVKAEINILNGAMEKVRSLYSSLAVTDPQEKSWDGKDEKGIVVGEDTYTIQVIAIDEAGNEMTNTEKKVELSI